MLDVPVQNKPKLPLSWLQAGEADAGAGLSCWYLEAVTTARLGSNIAQLGQLAILSGAVGTLPPTTMSNLIIQVFSRYGSITR